MCISLLDAACTYLPSPEEVDNYAFDQKQMKKKFY